MAISEKRKMISDEASFNKLSPSSIDDIRLGTFTNFKIALALTASGGDTIPPSRKPNANEKPGIILLTTKATVIAVRKTTTKAKLPIMRRQRHNSFHDMAQAPSYKSGGKIIRNISEGLTCNTGMPGMKLISNPAITNKTG